MNYLAHLWLAHATHTSAAGAVLGDVVHGRLEATELPSRLAQGIRIHRHVDAVTDHHPLSVCWRHQFPTALRRYAGITLDLLCDHALARDWAQYSPEPLASFAARTGRAVADQATWFERYGSWQPDAQHFTALLCSYARWEGFELALQRTSRRLHHPQPLLDTKPVASTLFPEVRAALPRLLQDLEEAAHAQVANRTH